LYATGNFHGLIIGSAVTTIKAGDIKAAARYIRERVCHPTQQLRDLGGGRLEMTLRVNHLLEVKRWVMSFGPDCEVLEPEQLRSEVAAELLQAVRQYGRV
jgi:predicted DNA-binding transcriptional regulator YafY